MCFRNYGFRKTSLNKSLKSPCSENPSTGDMVSVQETFEIWTTTPLPYLLITLQDIELEKIYLSDMPSLRNVCYHIDCRWKYSLLNRDNFRQPIPTQLSEKQKLFSELVSAYFNFILKFKRLHRQDNLHSWYTSEITDLEIRC